MISTTNLALARMQIASSAPAHLAMGALRACGLGAETVSSILYPQADRRDGVD
jgi:hypothetical protein